METASNHQQQLGKVLESYRLNLSTVTGVIDGSYWGDAEAGLIRNTLYIRIDTPLHSALHEACHFICMDQNRRQNLHTDAGGTDREENAVCYLQILLADHFPQYGRESMFHDMDKWGYSFRLGSAKAWFENDAEDAREYLLEHKLITPDEQVILGALRH